MGGRSGSSRDATMRSLLAENLDKAATKRTVAAITERNASDANADVADAEGALAADRTTVQPQGRGPGGLRGAGAARRPQAAR